MENDATHNVNTLYLWVLLKMNEQMKAEINPEKVNIIPIIDQSVYE